MSRSVLGEKQQLPQSLEEILKAPPPVQGPKSKKTINPTAAETQPPEIKLSPAETWFLDPMTFWRHLCTNRTNDEYIKMVIHLSRHASQAVAKAAVVPKSTPIPRNYMAWSGQFVDDDPKDSAYPDLFLFMEKVYKARRYVAKFPRVDFLLSWSLPIRMGFAKDYSDEDIQEFMELEEDRRWEESVKTSTKTLAITNDRLQQVETCIQAVDKTIHILKYEATEVRKRRRVDSTAEEDEEGENAEIEALEDINSGLRKALARIVSTIIRKGVVSRNFQKFAFDTANGKPFDMSDLEPKDKEFLIIDTQIVRPRNINGRLVFLLNDLSD